MSHLILLGRLSRVLYFVDGSLFNHATNLSKKSCLSSVISSSVANVVVQSKLDEAKLLHPRLGHVPYFKLNVIVK